MEQPQTATPETAKIENQTTAVKLMDQKIFAYKILFYVRLKDFFNQGKDVKESLEKTNKVIKDMLETFPEEKEYIRIAAAILDNEIAEMGNKISFAKMKT